ncbi:hypothetical protein [Arthrobacter russicus]|jgi:hypothetical protein|uniref:Integral membrane protein n=1 Tax=Arthrobacter russicus TaxID=172040 RepID=A0ABU1J6W8_9MICC|nr:hypothetical protein [Arthrobacter russicus]MDR6268167.1 hypothetical protein [Arthrobacter russicus]
MGPWGLPLSIIALLILVSCVVRFSRNLSYRMVGIMTGLLLIAICLLVNTDGVYQGFDQLMGGANHAYLLVQLTFLFGLFFVKNAFLPDPEKLAAGSRFPVAAVELGIAVVFGTAVTVLFFLSDLPVTDFRVESYRLQPAVIGFTQLINIYIGVSSYQLAARTLRLSRGLSGARRVWYSVMSFGFLIACIAVIERLVAALSSLSTGQLPAPVYQTVDGIFVLLALLLCTTAALGLALAHRSRRRTGQSAERDELF